MNLFHVPFICLVVWLTGQLTAWAAEYQFSVPVGGGHADARAFLWIPPTCERVRGVLLAQQVILEKNVCDDPIIRAACARAGLAIVIGYDTPFGYFDYSQGADKALQTTLDHLAAESGYAEIAGAPLLPIGHSGNAIFAWNIGYWNPARTLGIVTLHAAAIPPPVWDSKATPNGIPVLTVSGEYESWGNPNEPLDKHWRWLRGGLLGLRGQYSEALVSEIVQPGGSHFSWDAPLARYVAQFIEKVAAARLPANSNAGLKRVSPESGWLTDLTLIAPGRIPPVAARDFKGDPTLMFWHLDRELAVAADHYGDYSPGKADQRLTFVQDDIPVTPAWLPTLKFEPAADGVSLKVAADFLRETPAGVLGAGQPLGHANAPIQFRLIGGWGGGGEQTAPDVFRIRFDTFGINQRAGNLMLMAFQAGDREYKYAEQPAQIVFPIALTNGHPQKLVFDPIPDQPRGIKSLSLQARSDAGLPVDFLVCQGPGEIKGDRLNFSPLPPRAKFPVKVTVIAWQYGHGGVNPVQSAAPVEQTFCLQP